MLKTNYQKVKGALEMAWKTRLYPSPFIPLFISHTGVGKTAMIYQAVEEIFDGKGDVVYINLASINAADFGGFPLVDYDNKSVNRIPLDEFELLIKADKPVLFFLDEWNRFKDIGILQVLFNILRRQLGTKKMSDNVFFCAAENPIGEEDDTDKTYFVAERDEALYDRVAPIYLEKDFVSFKDYILYKSPAKPEIKTALISLLTNKPRYFETFTNRTLERVISILNESKDTLNDTDAYVLISTFTTTTFSRDLYEFVNGMFVDVSRILEGEFDKTLLKILEGYASVPYKLLGLTMKVFDYVNLKVKEGEYNENSKEIENFRKFTDFLWKNHKEIYIGVVSKYNIEKYTRLIRKILEEKDVYKEILRREDIIAKTEVKEFYED